VWNTKRSGCLSGVVFVTSRKTLSSRKLGGRVFHAQNQLGSLDFADLDGGDDVYPDVLDALGLGHRELGWLQVHCAPLLRCEGGAMATLHLQAAFEPPGDAEIHFLWSRQEGERDELAGHHELRCPHLETGEVVKLTCHLPLPKDVTSVQVEVLASVDERAARRVRSPWSFRADYRPSSTNAPLTVTDVLRLAGETALLASLGHVAIPYELFVGTQVDGRPEEPGEAGPFTVAVSGDGPRSEPGTTLLWRPGWGLPTPPPTPRSSRPPTVGHCPSCRGGLDADDVRAGACPACGEPMG